MSGIHAHRLDLAFPIYHSRHRSLRTTLIDVPLGGRVSHGRLLTVQALSQISFDLQPGDRCALIGHNGAGKSTLLHVISGLYEPTGGELEVTGQVTTLTNLLVGMEDEADGYENILVRGMMMGHPRRQVEARMEQIVAFAEIEEFIHLPLRTYSEGMRMRLAFAVCTAFESEILLIDEALGASDQAFLRKASARLEGLIQCSSIVVIASHVLDTLRFLCNVGIWLERGQIRRIGPLESTISAYLASHGQPITHEEPNAPAADRFRP